MQLAAIRHMSISAKFIGAVGGLLVVLFAVLAGVTFSMQGNALDSLLSAARQTVERTVTEQVGRDEEAGRLKAEQLSKMLAAIAPSAIASLSLSDLLTYARVATSDADISHVVFQTRDGKVLAAAGDPARSAGSTVVRDIVSSGVKLGKVVVGYNHDRVRAQVAATQAENRKNLEQMEAAKAGSLKTLLFSQVLMQVLIALGALAIIYVIARRITRPLGAAVAVTQKIALGHYDNGIEVTSRDEVGELLQAMNTMQGKLAADVAKMKRIADESLRVRVALDHARVGVLVAGTAGDVVYANEAVSLMLKKVGSALGDVDPAALAGRRLADLHPQLAEMGRRVATDSAEQQATITIGSRTFQLTVHAVANDAGERLGCCVEWLDATDELHMQQEVEEVVRAALNGDLTARIPVKGKSGFMQRLSQDLNHLFIAFHESIESLAEVLEAVANGDLTARVTKEYQGIFGELRDNINATVAKLTEVVSGIKGSSDLIHTAAREIANGNTDLSARTEEQAASLEETASSMEELTSTVKQNADNARQANQLASGARNQASQGGEVVTQAIASMEAISAASKRIADIIGVIDEIAFQTNLLALNAAVEAARAGEQGRGFAVVASEVRNLAQRSAQAAKEIKELIHDSVEKVKAGSALVDRSGETLSQIVESVKKVTDIVGEIAAASQEQAAGIEQVNKAVMQMDRTTQENGALVEEAAAASKSMEEQAQALAGLVGFFLLGQDEHAAAPSHTGHARSASGSPPSPSGRRGGDEGPHPLPSPGGRGEVGENPYSGRNEGEGARVSVERRGANRPWSKQQESPAAASGQAARAVGDER
jgi:methyl-accepting chemotaxis protein